MSATLAPTPQPSPLGRAHWTRLAPAALPLGAGLAILLVLFHAEAIAAVKIWWQSTAYGHCFLVLPLALWLAYERREVVLGLAVTPLAPRIALYALPLVGLWVVSYVLGIMEGRQLAAMGFAQLLFFAVLGRDLYFDLSPALLYLVFLVPFGAFAAPVLQHFTAGFIVHGLDTLGIPNRADAFRIEIPEGTFYVAEACAGLRFLIASMAFGVLYAVTMFRSPFKRVAFIVASMIVPVVANGFRGLGIVVLGHVLGSAEAAATDHLIYGWVFFTIVTIALAMGGLPYREDLLIAASPRSVADYARGATGVRGQSRTGFAGALTVVAKRSGFAVTAAVLGLAVMGPAIGTWLDHRVPDLTISVVPEPSIPGDCSPGASHVEGGISVQRFTCPDATLTMTVAVFAPGSNPARVIGTVRDIASAPLAADSDQSTLTIDGAKPDTWVLISENVGKRASAYVLWLDGKPALGGLRDRIHLAQDMLNGGHRPPLGAVITVEADRGVRSKRLRDFIMAQDQLSDQVQGQLKGLEQ